MKRPPTGIGLGPPPFQHLHIRSAFHDYPEVCICSGDLALLYASRVWKAVDLTTTLVILPLFESKGLYLNKQCLSPSMYAVVEENHFRCGNEQ